MLHEMGKEQEMKTIDTLAKSKKAIGGLILIFIICLLIFFAGMRYASRSSEPKITSTTIVQELKEVSDLTVLEYNFTKVGKFQNSLQLNGWDIPLTTKSFLLTYQGQLKAGIDMSKIDAQVEDKNIIITLPDVAILSNIIDENSIEVYDESTNIFNPIRIGDYAAFATQQKDKAEEEAIENGLLSQAATKAEDAIRRFLTMIPQNKEEYTIDIKFAENSVAE